MTSAFATIGRNPHISFGTPCALRISIVILKLLLVTLCPCRVENEASYVPSCSFSWLSILSRTPLHVFEVSHFGPCFEKVMDPFVYREDKDHLFPFPKLPYCFSYPFRWPLEGWI